MIMIIQDLLKVLGSRDIDDGSSSSRCGHDAVVAMQRVWLFSSVSEG